MKPDAFPEAFSINGNTLWLLEKLTTEADKGKWQIRIVSFKYKFGDECSEPANERRVILPEGVLIKKSASSKDDLAGYREKLIQNLQRSEFLSTANKAGSQDTAAMIKQEVDAMTEEKNSQIMTLRYGNVFINTMEHGLKYFNLGTLKNGKKDNAKSDEEID